MDLRSKQLCSLLLAPCSLLLAPCSLLLAPCSPASPLLLAFAALTSPPIELSRFERLDNDQQGRMRGGGRR